MANAACQNEEVKDGMHVTLFVERIKEGASDVANAFCYNPYNGSSRHGVNKGFKGYEDTEAHADETKRFKIGVFFQSDKTHNGAGYGT